MNKPEGLARRTVVLMPGVLLCSCMRGAAPVGQISGVVLDCTVELSASQLRARYSVRNTRANEIGIVMPIVPDGAPCYVDLDGPMLLLERFVLPIPPGLQTAGQPVPHAVRLAPGRTYTDEFSIAEPVLVNNPYRKALLAARSPGAAITASKQRRVQDITFSSGVFEVDPNIRFTPAPDAGPGYNSVLPPGAAIARQVILSKIVRVESGVRVLDF